MVVEMTRDLAFNVTLAKAYGVDGAVLLHHLAFWVYRNEVNDRNFHDETYWTYNSHKAYAELFPMWNTAKIKRILRRLEEQGAIRVGNFNKAKFDRTNWYTITDAVRKVYTAEDSCGPSMGQKSTTRGAKPSQQYQVTKQVTNSGDYSDEDLQEVVPEFKNIETWRNYVQHRKEIGKKLTPLAYKQALAKVVRLSNGSAQKFDDICNNSISNGWTGLFDTKDKRRGFDPAQFKTDKLVDWASNGSTG